MHQNINCKVHACKYHEQEDKCSLDSILVGAQECNACQKQDTLCASFEAK